MSNLIYAHTRRGAMVRVADRGGCTDLWIGYGMKP